MKTKLIRSCPGCAKKLYFWGSPYCPSCSTPLEATDSTQKIPAPYALSTVTTPPPEQMKALQQLLSPRGRASRTEFWCVHFCFVIYFVALRIADIFIVPMEQGAIKITMIVLGLLILFLGIWMNLAVQVRRWRDLGLPWPLVLINLVPIIGSLASLIILGFSPSRERKTVDSLAATGT